MLLDRHGTAHHAQVAAHIGSDHLRLDMVAKVGLGDGGEKFVLVHGEFEASRKDRDFPRVDEEKLTVFHGYLSENLTFPFEAEYSWQDASLERVRRIVKVTGLLDADSCSWMDGLLCEGRLDKEGFERPLTWFDVAEDDPKLQPLVDYYYWFYNYH